MKQSGEKPLKPGGVGSKVVCGVGTEAVDLDAAIICCVDFILPEAPQKAVWLLELLGVHAPPLTGW